MKSSLNSVKPFRRVLFVVLYCLMFSESALAWSAQITPFVKSIETLLKDIGIPLITVALMFIGYQIVFGSKSLKALWPVVVGSLVVGSAPVLATMLLAGA